LLIQGNLVDRPLAKLALWFIYALCLTFGVSILNAVVIGNAAMTGSAMYLFGVISATVLVINGMMYLGGGPNSNAVSPEVQDPATRFLRRLPLEVRGKLVRIEAQGHYLNVVTDKGQALILLRMGEAMAEREGVAGLQTHRSHWVLLAGVSAHRRVQGKDFLILTDGAEVPVARARRDAAKGCGPFRSSGVIGASG